MQKTIVSPPKALGWGDKVRALDMIPEMLEGKHGYLDTTWRLEEVVHVLVSDSIFVSSISSDVFFHREMLPIHQSLVFTARNICISAVG